MSVYKSIILRYNIIVHCEQNKFIDWTVFIMEKYNIQTGRLYDKAGKNFDITVIVNFPTQSDYDNCTSIDDFPSVNLIDFYFGDMNDQDTEKYVNQFIEKQNKLKKLYTKLLELKSICPDDSEITEQIDFVKTLIVQLH